MVLTFLTFGGPSRNYLDAVNRICNQAKSFGMFDNIYGMTDADLKNDYEFWDKHGKFIEQNSKGYGYWIWKSYLILKTLKYLNEGDILLYLDSGCELNVKLKSKLELLIEKTKEKRILGSSVSSNDVKYTKKDLLEYFKLENMRDMLLKSHMQAGCLLIMKCDMIMKFIGEWYELCQNYHFIDDSPSISLNDPKFIEHRHDQSVFNLLVKKYDLTNYDIPLKNSVIVCNRNRSGKSLLK